MSSPDSSPPMATYESLCTQPELRETADPISIYAPAIYGQDTVRAQLRETLNNRFPSVHVVEDDEDEADVIKVYYYADEDDINEDEVLQVVNTIDGDAYIKN